MKPFAATKEYKMKRTIIAAAICAIAALGTGSVEARGKSVSGTWTLKIEQVGLRLELAQQKNVVTGTFDWPHGDAVKLTGTLKGDILTFAGNSGGENFSVRIESTATLKADGTMTGLMKAHFVDLNDVHEVVRTWD